jgi:DNA-binding NarL/FixJ family response regulator
VGLKVGIAADIELTRRRAISALEQDGLDVVLSAGVPDALAAAPGIGGAIDVAVVALSELPPAAAARAFRLVDPELPLVVVCPPDGWSGLRRVLERGADGVVPSKEIESRLACTVRAVCAGHAAVPRPERPTIDVETLSPREKQVLGMVVMGFSNGEIARSLHLAESTIKSHLSCAFAKLKVGSRKDAAALILDPHDGLGPGILAISGG